VPTGADSPDDDLEATAKALHDCLEDRGLPAVYATMLDGRPTIVSFDESVPAYWVLPSNDTEWTYALSDSQYQEAFDQYRAKREREQSKAGGQATTVFLLVSGIDRTDDWATCIDQSGYDDAAVWDSYDPKPLNAIWDQMVIKASNDWARCAREHGINDVIDAHPAADETDLIAVLLPLTLAEDQLRDLIAACPVFDPAVEDANDEIARQALAEGKPYIDIIDQLTAQPSVYIDSSSLDSGNGSNDLSLGDHFDRLVDILLEARNKYYNG
jgi:hypothetical protein